MPETSASQNNANYLRDHLANERTYLAWIRTAVALLGFGVLVVRSRLPSVAAPDNQTANALHLSRGHGLGLGFAIAGLLTVLVATWQYFAVRRAIETASYRPSGWWIVALSIAVAFIGVLLLYSL
jgi:putative membrane protein